MLWYQRLLLLELGPLCSHPGNKSAQLSLRALVISTLSFLEAWRVEKASSNAGFISSILPAFLAAMDERRRSKACSCLVRDFKRLVLSFKLLPWTWSLRPCHGTVLLAQLVDEDSSLEMVGRSEKKLATVRCRAKLKKNLP